MRCCSVSIIPLPGTAVDTSDQRVSFLRSSKGNSNRVASMRVVSSIDTVSTQSKVSPIGNESRTSIVRSLIKGSMFARLLGATTGETVFRCTSCFGGSIAINISTSNAPSGSGASIGMPRVIPCCEEKFLWSISTALMSS